MIRIGITGGIGSGKSFVAKNFKHPVFNADYEVSKLYKKDRKIFNKLKKKLPKYISNFPLDKKELVKAILGRNSNLKTIVKVVHREIRKKLNIFIKKNRQKKFIIMDIPLLMENKINKKKDILIFVDAKKEDIEKRLKKRPGYNKKLLNKFKKIQFKLKYKKKKAHFIIKNKFSKIFIKKEIRNILNQID